MSRKTHKHITFMSVLIMIIVTAFLSASTAKADGPWHGNPDPYDCESYDDCFWIVTVCIEGVTDKVGFFDPPGIYTDAEMVSIAQFYTGTELTMGTCRHAYTGRWVHTYVGKTWACNLVSKAGEDKDAPRFSNIDYVKQACGDHPLFGPFEGTANYVLCREINSNGTLYCGNHYDTSY